MKPELSDSMYTTSLEKKNNSPNVISQSPLQVNIQGLQSKC